jgi:predicted nucleotidyltransferase
MKQITYEYLKENNCILYECIVGSQAYATNVETSDIDKKFVYILPQDYILGTGYVEQLNVNKDYVGWEIKRFLELIGSSNPTVLELLNTPEDCIITKHPLFDYILNHKADFITKGCRNSFAGYAVQQIQKAKGLNKKQNIEQGSVTRKDVLDFCYVIQGEKSIPWKVWCVEKPQYGREYIKYENKFCGIVNVPHAKDLYAVYHDEVAQACFSEHITEEDREVNKKYYDEPYDLGYKGIAKVGGSDNAAESNQLRLSSIPKGETPICNMMFNKDGYTAHCKDYKEYMEWVENRNTQRYVDTKKHGQQIDGKNMMHCMRLIRMAKEIGRGEGIKVRRADREELLAIRRGEVDLETLIETAEAEIKEMDRIFEDSDLPKGIDPKLVNHLLIKIRREFYAVQVLSEKLKYNSRDEVIYLFSNGFEKYNTDPIFRQIIYSLCSGANLNQVIEQLIDIINKQQEEMLKVLIKHDSINGID